LILINLKKGERRLESYAQFVNFVKDLYGSNRVMLHKPTFRGNEIAYLKSCVESNFVSSAGQGVIDFEDALARFTHSRNAVAVVNGTAALHSALTVLGVKPGDEVITQALSFVATSNAIAHCGAKPIFVDVDIDTMGMSPNALRRWLIENTTSRDGELINRKTNATIKACLPMHTFGMPCRIKEISDVCDKFGLYLLEDCAEALGSFVDNSHVGSFGAVATFSFNGNKVITSGGGGMVVTDSDQIAARLRHLTTTAKVPHPFEYYHDEVAFNYRMPNLNAALGLAQMESLPTMLAEKSYITEQYNKFCQQHDFRLAKPIDGSTSNNWLNALILDNRSERDHFLNFTNSRDVMTRPIWTLLSDLPMYQSCQKDTLQHSSWLRDRVVNVPSSAFEKE
jgi:perosamine synthetase